jgi:tetratricopeptide (TPR) repeat protein
MDIIPKFIIQKKRKTLVKVVFRQNWLLSLLVVTGLTSISIPVQAQAFLPYTPQFNSEKLDEQGALLLQDAIQLIRFREYDLALSRAKLASQLSPTHYETWFILGSLYIQEDKLDEGLNALKKAKELAPDDPDTLFALGSAYFRLGDYTTAISEIQAGLKIEPSAPQALFDLGNSYLMLKEDQQAILAYEKAVNLEKEFWPAVNNIGLIEYEKGNINGAIKKWEEALAIDGEQAEPQLAIAVALYKQGNELQAIRLGEKALSLDDRYGSLDFLEENLWGKNLLKDTEYFFQNPKIKAIIVKIKPREELQGVQ